MIEALNLLKTLILTKKNPENYNYTEKWKKQLKNLVMLKLKNKHFTNKKDLFQ